MSLSFTLIRNTIIDIQVKSCFKTNLFSYKYFSQKRFNYFNAFAHLFKIYWQTIPDFLL